MSKWIKRILPLVILGMAIAAFVVLKNSKLQQPPVEIKEKVWMVNTQTVQLAQLAASQTLYGQVESNAMVQAAAPIAAVVAQVAVKPGDEVKAGQTLIALAAEDMTIPVVQARADAADAKAQLKLQALNVQANQQRLVHEQKVLELKQEALSRARTLLQKNLAAQSVVDAAKEALVKQEYVVVGATLAVQQADAQGMQLQARLQKAQAALQQVELNQKRGVVRAPYAARVATVAVSEGDRVNPGSALVSFYGLDSMEFKAKLPVSSLVQAQQALQKPSPLNAYLRDAQQEHELPLLRLAGEASTSGVDAYFALPEKLQTKRPGELLAVQFRGQSLEQVVAVPFSAIYGNDRVYVVVDQRLQAVAVEIKGELMREGKAMALIRGEALRDGQKLLVTHLPNAIDGLKVVEVQP
ncbi:MAG: biotin/lipoyl-binding protein [Thiotrichales bacterium]|nr:biotin/lipoyl-binding protein [Thiotrichales bacterium]